VRDTVFLATVLFLVGISGHLLRAARYAVVTLPAHPVGKGRTV